MPDLPELPGVEDRLVKPREARHVLGGMPQSTFGDQVRSGRIAFAERSLSGHRKFSFMYLLTVRAKMLGVSVREALERLDRTATVSAAS